MLKTHAIALTIDCDADGPAGSNPAPDRSTWHALDRLLRDADRLRSIDGNRERVPLTWFVRADDAVRAACGHTNGLFHRFEGAWRAAQSLDDEIGWHPHLLAWVQGDIHGCRESSQACDQLRRTWDSLQSLPYGFRSFRNGDAWHTADTLRTVEGFGITCDSSAVPGRRGPDGHPRDWRGAPNIPYFPSSDSPCSPGGARDLLEIPMTTWWLQGPDETVPRLRYMNPAFHPRCFRQAVEALLRETEDQTIAPVSTMVFHPFEVLRDAPAQGLIAQSLAALIENVQWFAQALRRRGIHVSFVTLTQISEHWRRLPRDA